MWKDAPCHQSLGKFKLKSQRDTTVHLLECLKLKRLTIPNVAKEVRQVEFSYTSAGTIKWHN